MPKSQQPSLFVVDGSNIATEGRSEPSLEQLNDAVLAFMEEYPDVTVTVVVDATFGHRIAKKEVKSFDEAVANNELVTPPAGAIGRGDAFVLSIANKANAGVLSNDSFQEFHGEYEWLFDEGRLVGGKPVPHVGWVWVNRTPVRGPKSRQAVKDAKSARPKRGDRTEAKQAANRRVRKKSASSVESPSADSQSADSTSSESPSAQSPSAPSSGDGGSKDHVNELMPFLDFVERHPVGTGCTAVVESYASHGAYARMDDVLIYIPLRMMDDPAPRSARKALTVGDSVALVVVGFTPDRRSIDAALPHVASAHLPGDVEAATVDIAAIAAEPAETPASETDRAPSARKKPAAKKAATKKAPAKKVPAKKVPAKKAPAKKAATRKTAAKKAAAKKAPAKKAATKKAATKRAPAKKTAAKKSTAKKTTAKKTTAKKTTAKRAPAKKTGARKATGS